MKRIKIVNLTSNQGRHDNNYQLHVQLCMQTYLHFVNNIHIKINKGEITSVLSTGG